MELCLEHKCSSVEAIGKLSNLVISQNIEKVTSIPARDRMYMKYISEMSCEGYPDDCGIKPVQVHHVGRHAMGQKTDDYRTIPLCYKCHNNWHKNYSGEDKEYYSDLMLYHLINFMKIQNFK